jgi:hypothetical protein
LLAAEVDVAEGFGRGSEIAPLGTEPQPC